MELFNREWGYALQITEYLFITEGETFKDTACNLSVCFRYCLPCPATIFLNSLYHGRRICKAWRIRIYQRSKSRSFHCSFNQLRIGVVIADGPFTTATFQQPHTTDILQKAYRTIYSTFIREVHVETLLINNRLVQLYPHQ